MRLIDADYFIEKLAEAPMIQEAMSKAVNHMPTVEVVRCKDCKCLRIKQDWFGNNGEELAQCKQWDAPISDMNGFCSWAERREDK